MICNVTKFNVQYSFRIMLYNEIRNMREGGEYEN